MHHELRAGVSQRLVVGIGIAGVKREVIGGLRVHLRRRNGIEAFRGLTVAFADLGSEIARPAANGIGFQQREPARAVLLPNLELGLLFEQPDQHRRLQIHVLLGHVR